MTLAVDETFLSRFKLALWGTDTFFLSSLLHFPWFKPLNIRAFTFALGTASEVRLYFVVRFILTRFL